MMIVVIVLFFVMNILLYVVVKIIYIKLEIIRRKNSEIYILRRKIMYWIDDYNDIR